MGYELWIMGLGSGLGLSDIVLCCVVFSCLSLILSCLVLSCPAMSCLALRYPCLAFISSVVLFPVRFDM
jgi:hypothetical protein